MSLWLLNMRKEPVPRPLLPSIAMTRVPCGCPWSSSEAWLTWAAYEWFCDPGRYFVFFSFCFLFRLVVYSGGISSRRRGGCRRAGIKRVVVFLVVHSAPIAETEEGWEGCPPVLTADKENVVHDAAKDLRRLRIDCSAGDLLLVNTRMYWHQTEIPAQNSLSISFARDFYFDSEVSLCSPSRCAWSRHLIVWCL